MKTNLSHSAPLLISYKLVSCLFKTALVASLSITAIACSQSEFDSAQTKPAPMSQTEEQHEAMHHQGMKHDGMQHETMSQDGKHHSMTHGNMNSKEPAEALGQDYSIYQVGGEWTDHNDNKIELEALKGKNQVVVMAYTSCQHTCPILVRGMKQIEKGLTDEARADTEFLLVTLDTERDTVPVMKSYAEHNDLGNHWHLIRSTEANTRMLANTLNIKYQFTDNGDINHSNLLSILDKQGRLVAQEIGVADSGLNPLTNYLNTHS